MIDEPAALIPLSRPKLGEETAEQLRDAILHGQYKPGMRLPIDALARQLGVSAMPVREGLLILAQEGLVESLPRRGFLVARVHRRDVEDIFAVHAFIAGVQAERAAAAIDDATLLSLTKLQDEIDYIAGLPLSASQRAVQIEDLNYSFHRTINKVVASQRLLWFLRATTRYVPRKLYEVIPGWLEATVTDHRPILSALRNHDALLAGTLMEEHILNGGRLVVNELDTRGVTTLDSAF